MNNDIKKLLHDLKISRDKCETLEEDIELMNEAAKTIPALRQTIRQRDERIIELNNKLSSANTDIFCTNQALEILKESSKTKEKLFKETE